MAFKIKSFFFIIFLCAVQTVSAQDDVIVSIKDQAEKVVKSVFVAEYDTLIKYTHPNIIEFSGGKDVLVNAIKKQMADLESQNATMDKVIIGEEIIAKRYKNEYHALVPRTIIMTINDQTLTTDGYLFGFSNSEGKNWTFVEADKLKSEAAKKLFPNFKTNIKIPEKGQTLPFEGELTPQTFDDNEGSTKSAESTFHRGGYKVGYIIGVLGIIAVTIGMLVGIFLFVRYRMRKKNEKGSEPESVIPVKPKTDKITCQECDSENRSDSKYCVFCGYALLKVKG